MNNRNIRFLMVEDDDDHAMLAMRAIKKSGINTEVVRVTDGVEAMEFLRKEGDFVNSKRPTVVLLDLNLPRMSGLEVLREIREDRDLSEIPVIIVSTSTEEEDISAAYGLKVNSYLRKPVQSDQFQKMFEEMCVYWGSWNEPPKK